MNHYFHNIQGWFIYNDIYRNAVLNALPNSQFVEVGSWRGRSTAFLGVEIENSCKDITVHCVDTWKGSLDEDAHQNDPSVINDTLYDEFLENIKPISKYIKPVRMTSMEAVKLYEDNSFDFILIDGGHDYNTVKDDITEWLKKLKPGHIIAGDDYAWEGVKKAVDELLPTAQINHNIGCWMYTKP